MTRSAVAIGSLLSAVLLLAACGGGPSTSSAMPTSSLVPPASDTRSDTPSGPSASSTPAAVVVDEALIDHLPGEVAGIALTIDPATAGDIASDPTLAASASAIAVAFAIAPGASVGGDVAVASVVQLRPGAYDAEFFRAWRDSYDRAACDVAGGVVGNAQAVIAGRDVYIGRCTAGAHTYHVYLEASNVIVSVTSVGELSLGEQVVAGLRE